MNSGFTRPPSQKTEDLFVSRNQRTVLKRLTGAVRDHWGYADCTERLGYTPEMGHKEVGSLVQLRGSNEYIHMEQIEIDWRYDHALQADNGFCRNIVLDVFKYGLDVTFKAKPIEVVRKRRAPSCQHYRHRCQRKETKHLPPSDMNKDFLSPLGYGFVGILNHGESINPFVTNSNDAFNRLRRD